jgi:hypothetical protein
VATDLTPAPPPPPSLEPQPEPAPTPRRRSLHLPKLRLRTGRAYRGRMLVIYALLLLAVGGAIAAAVLVPTSKHTTARGFHIGPWSSWEPSTSGTYRTKEIAAHVSRLYRDRKGNEFVYAVAQRPRWQGNPIIALAVAGEIGSEDKVTVTLDSDTVMYNLCGHAQSCLFDHSPGQPDLMYLRREALELALFTFKYIPEAKNVVVLTPLRLTNTNPVLLFWQRSDLALPLSRPLSATMSEKPPPFGVSPPPEVEQLHNLVDANVFLGDALDQIDGTVIFQLGHLPLS